jgi:hypothetical protein
MVYGRVLDQYSFFILKDMTKEYLERTIEDIEQSIYIEAKLRKKGVDLDKNITLKIEEDY